MIVLRRSCQHPVSLRAKNQLFPDMRSLRRLVCLRGNCGHLQSGDSLHLEVE